MAAPRPFPGVSARVVDKKGDRYNAGRDPETDHLAIGIAAEIKALTGKDVYLVVARFDRKFIDANRPPEVAYDNPAASPYYQHYHQSIRAYLDEIRAKFPAALLIDVHGQHKMRDSLVRGTLNGKSVAKLIARFGPRCHHRTPGTLRPCSKATAFACFPPTHCAPKQRTEDAVFNGGFTTMTYGSHRKDGIDAIQFEFAPTTAAARRWMPRSARRHGRSSLSSGNT
jgi:N-formylglutamate amidohydrolase